MAIAETTAANSMAALVPTDPIWSSRLPFAPLPAIDGELRQALRKIARSTPRKLDSWWKHRCAPTGPAVQVVDMFSGCGGMSAGFVASNSVVSAYKLVCAIDVDRQANETFADNLGLTPVEEDVARLSRSPRVLASVLESAGYDPSQPSVFIGCAPCQGFSSHRNDAGQSDQRNNLFLDFARIAARLKPSMVLIENVPELLTDRYWPFVKRAMGVLRDAGFFVRTSILNFAEFGLAQERFRTVIIGSLRPFEPPSGFLKRTEFRTVREAISHLPTVNAGVKSADDAMHFSAGHKASTISTIRAVPKDGGSRPENVGPKCLERARSRNGRAVYEDVYGRLFWDRPAITITASARNPASGRYVHPEQDRALTIREAALLQGFPRDYYFSGSLDDKFKQIGNAVPPLFSTQIALHLLGEMLSQAPAEFAAGITRSVGPSFSRLIAAVKAGHRESFDAR